MKQSSSNGNNFYKKISISFSHVDLLVEFVVFFNISFLSLYLSIINVWNMDMILEVISKKTSVNATQRKYPILATFGKVKNVFLSQLNKHLPLLYLPK